MAGQAPLQVQSRHNLPQVALIAGLHSNNGYLLPTYSIGGAVS